MTVFPFGGTLRQPRITNGMPPSEAGLQDSSRRMYAILTVAEYLLTNVTSSEPDPAIVVLQSSHQIHTGVCTVVLWTAVDIAVTLVATSRRASYPSGSLGTSLRSRR